jgi:hypothetical protein
MAMHAHSRHFPYQTHARQTGSVTGVFDEL